jgi:hypothetical protein
MELLILVIIGLLWLGLFTPPTSGKIDNKPDKYWNNGR